MTETVLVTGGQGFIGRYVVEELLRRGHKVLAFDRRGSASHPGGVEMFMGDIRNANAVTDAMAHATGFIHLAGILGTQETIANPRPSAETNIMGGLNVLEAAAQYKVHGVNIAVGNWWMNNTYSLTKNTVERFCQMYRKDRGAPVSVVRALNAYGPRQVASAPYGPSRVRKIMPSFICRALNGEPIEIYGDGQQIMDMVFVSDVATVLVNTLERSWEQGPVEKILEAGTGRRTTVTQIAEAVIAAVGSGEIKYIPMRPGSRRMRSWWLIRPRWRRSASIR